MVRVRMLIHVQGGHASGQPWPEAGGILETDEREARDLVRGLMAEWADEPAPAIPPPAPVAAAEPPAAEPADDEAREPDNGSESDGRPRARDPKDAWEAYAVTQGMTPEDAAATSKADLYDRYKATA